MPVLALSDGSTLLTVTWVTCQVSVPDAAASTVEPTSNSAARPALSPALRLGKREGIVSCIYLFLWPHLPIAVGAFSLASAEQLI